MNRIVKAPETMTSRERVLRTFAYEKTDRVPIGYDANPGIDARLKAALGAKDGEELRQALGADIRGIRAEYTGPLLYPAAEGLRVDPVEGFYTRKVEHATGYYWDYCNFPLQGASDGDFANFPVVNPDDFDYDSALAQAKAYGGQYALYVGNAGFADIINSNGRLMGMEDVLCHLITGYEPALDLIRRRADMQLGVLERLLDKCRGFIDFLWFGEDLGTQIAPMISLELYRSILRPIHQEFADLARSYRIPCLVHTCGSSSWVYEDFIEMGISGVDTLQPEAANMSPEFLAAHFGGRLNFRGCISTAGPLAYGTPEETRAVCRDTLAVMMGCRGYHFAPTHEIQDNTPVENAIAMYQAAHDLGRY